MAGEVAAERLYVQIVADAAGFRKDLQTKVATSSKGLKVRVPITLDRTGFTRDVQAATKAASKAAKVKASIKLDRAGLTVAAREASLAASKAAKVKASITLDRTGFTIAARNAAETASKAAKVRASITLNRAGLSVAAREAALTASKSAKVHADVSFNIAQVRRALREVLLEASANLAARVDVEYYRSTARRNLQRAISEAAQSVRVPRINLMFNSNADGVAVGLRAAGTALRTLSIGPAIASGILVLAGALTNLVGGLYAVVSASSQAVGVLGALPGLAAAAAQGLGVLAIGFSGISGAMKAMEAADKSAGSTAQKSAGQQARSADQIAAARRRLAEARVEAAERISDAEEQGAERVAEAEKRAAETIAAAERGRADAVRNAKRAEDELSRARERAREEIQQLAFSLREASLSEEQAAINLEHAQLKVMQSRQSTVMSPLDRRQAELDYKQAILDLEEAKDRTADLTAENNKAKKAGVEGSEDVRDAKERLADANREVRDAERELAQARSEGAAEVAKAQRESARDIARARKEGAKQVRDAQEALAQSMKSTAAAADTSSAAMNNLGFAMNKLGPAGQRFAQFLHNTVVPRMREFRDAVQAVLLPRMEKAFRAAGPLLGVLQKGFVKTAATVGDLAVKFGRLAGSAPFRKDTATIMSSNDRVVKSFGNALFFLFQALTDVLVVAGPLTERFARMVENWAKGRAEAAKTGRETGRMAAYFERAWETAAQLGHILGDVWAALRNIGKAATPTGETLLDSLARGAESLRKWTENPENQQRMHDFFQNTIPFMEQFAELLGKIVKLFGRLGEITGGHGLDGLFFVLDAFVDFLNKLTQVPGSGTVLTTILILAGAGFGLGIVARALGKIMQNLTRLARLTGLTRLFTMMTGGGGGGGGGRSQVGRLADDVERLTGEIDKELPKDDKKKQALGEVGGAAGKARKPVQGVAGDVLVAGKGMEQAGKKTSKFGRVLNGLKGALGKVGKGLAGFGGLLLAIPGAGAVASKFGASLKAAFAKIKLPSIGGKAAAGGAAKGGLLAGLLPGLLGKLPSFKGILGRVQTWASGLVTSIKKMFTGSKIAALVKGGAKGGAKGGVGGPVGILGGILAGILGSAIGGGKGGARGALGGGISGAAGGAGIGAMIGSVVPVLGTAIGAAVGGIVGAVVGAITGGKYWSAIGTFFTATLPGWIVAQVKKLPGALGTALGALGGLGMSLIRWAGKEIDQFGKWIHDATLKAIQAIPVLIVEMFFLLPRLIAKASAAAPQLFSWLVDQAARIVPQVLKWITFIPRLILGGLALAASRVPSVFGWMVDQAKKMPGRIASFFKNLPGMIVRLFTNPPDVFGWLKRQAGNVGRIVGSLMGQGMTQIKNAIVRGMGDAGRRAAERLSEITQNFRLARNRWGQAISDAMSRVVNYVRDRLGSARDWAVSRLASIRNAFVGAKNSVTGQVRSTFNSVRDTIANRMGQARDKVYDILNKIKNAFRSARDNISAAWTPIGRMLAGPVNWIGRNVYERGIKWIWDKVAKLVGKGGLPGYTAFAGGGTYTAAARGRVLPGYTPRRDVHRFVSPTGGTLDMSGGEAVMVPEWTRAVGSARVQVWNKLARSGGPAAVAAAMAQDFTAPPGSPRRAFKNGGVLPHQKFDIGGLFGGVKDFLGGIKDGFTGGLAAAASKVLDPILSAVAGAMGAGTWGDLVKAFPKTMTEPFLAWLTKVIEPKLGGDAKGVVKAAKSMIGQGDDRGPNNNWITRQWGMIGAPWCAMFVSEAIKKAKAEKYYPGYPSAAVASYVGAMKHVGEGRAGDLGAYRGTGHINIIEKRESGGYMTIGGNQNAVVQRGVRGGQSSILRPKFAGGGVLTADLIRNAVRIFKTEAPRNADRHEMDTPLVAFMNRLTPAMVKHVTGALVKSGTAIGQPLLRDSGGPVPPGALAYNGLKRTEWMLTPEAVDFLGGGRAVDALNAGTSALYRKSRTITGVTARGGDTRNIDAAVNVYPQRGQSETEIGVIAARKLGAMIR